MTVFVTVTLAVPPTEPLVAWTVAEPMEAGAAYRPLGLIAPTPLTTAQLKAGWVARALPNWSLALAVNCCVPPPGTLGVAGETAMLVRACWTVTVTALVAVDW